MTASAMKVRRWTRAEYDQMIERGVFEPGERVELVDGEILVVTPQGTSHATAMRLVEEALRAVFREGFEIRAQLPLAVDPASEPDPDVVVVPGSPRDYRDAHPTTALLVVEIAGTTLAFDRERKGSLYARAGIADYWILNLVDQVLEVYRDPEPSPSAHYGWAHRTVGRLNPTDFVSPVAAPDARISVADLLP